MRKCRLHSLLNIYLQERNLCRNYLNITFLLVTKNSNMAFRKGISIKKQLLAKISEKSAPCAFCRQEVDEEALYGKLYSIGDIHCHYFCVLLSCCLIQKGKDNEGLFGFLYPDILAEIERSKKHKCSYCNKEGATLGCSVTQCRKQFHLPCGKQKNGVSLFYGNFKSFCQKHAPKQKIPDDIMIKARARKSRLRKIKEGKLVDDDPAPDPVCVICYEVVEGFPSTQTFCPPCCGSDAWFHRQCIQRMSLSAGIHYLKCPLCNDKDNFYQAVLSQGYYVPDRDAAWELEQNAFSEIYERHIACTIEECVCPRGREHDEDTGAWSVQPCVLCGWSGAHAGCGGALWLCAACAPAAPDARRLEGIQRQSLPTSNRAPRPRRGPRIPTRMSLRRTKQRTTNMQSSSSNTAIVKVEANKSTTSATEDSRLELNLKTPKKRRLIEPSLLKNIENTLLSPIKLLEEGLCEIPDLNITLDNNVLNVMRDKFKRPKPLKVKKEIVNNILDELLKNFEIRKDPKKKEPIKESVSPKKTDINEISNMCSKIKCEAENDYEDIKDISHLNKTGESEKVSNIPENPTKTDTAKLTTVNIEEDAMEISENNQIININLIKVESESTPLVEKCALKFSPTDKEQLENHQVDIDVESFKSHYLSEVGQYNKIIPKMEDMHTKYIKGNSDVKNNKNTSKLKRRKSKKKNHTELSIRNKSINFKIKFKNDDLKVKIKKKKKRRQSEDLEYVINIDDGPKILKQYVINQSSNIIARPEVDVTPMKKKRIKLEKSPDNLKQTSIASFFTIKNNTIF